MFCIVPPYMLEHMAGSKDAKVRRGAIEAIEASAENRATRAVLREMSSMAAVVAPNAKKQRLGYDVSALPGKLVRSEGQPKVADVAVNEAYDHSGTTYDFYLKRFQRQSLDGAGHGAGLERAPRQQAEQRQQVAYGDGDGNTFIRFTKSLEAVGHELTHGVIAHECNLVYQQEPGVLNEHFADAFGMLMRQWKKKEIAA